MADIPVTQPKSSLDAWLDADEAKTQTRVVDLGKPLVTSAEVDLTAEKPPVPEAPPETPPPAEPIPETPPAETPEEPEDPETPEAGAEPAEITGVAVAGETKPPTRPRWKDVREADKRAKEAERKALEQERRALELERELAYARGRQEAVQQTPPAAPEVPEEELDPITKLERETAALKNEIQQLRGQQVQTQVERSIVDQEMHFERTHPDYRAALKHFIEAKKSEVSETGELDAIAEDLRSRNRQGVLDEALRRGVSEHDAARELAFGIVVLGERNRIVEGARRTGRNVAEVIYNLASHRGFKAPATPAVVTPTPKPDPKVVAEASQSLSGVARSQTPPPPRAIRSRQDLLRMDPKDLEKFIDQNDAETGNAWLESLG